MTDNQQNSAPQTDIELVAYLDDELDVKARTALEARLAAEPELAARLDALRAGGMHLKEGYDLLLEDAPTDRLAAILADAEIADATRHTAAPRRFYGMRALAAALVILIAGGALGYAIDQWVRPASVDVAAPRGWRAVVAEYVALYTPETFAAAPSDPEAYATRLKSLGERLGIDLDVANVALPDLDLKGAIYFEYDGKPLGQIAYLSPQDGPVALCIINNGRPDAAPAFEVRQDRNVVFWTKNGRGYLIIGKVPRDTLESYAASIESRVS